MLKYRWSHWDNLKFLTHHTLMVQGRNRLNYNTRTDQGPQVGFFREASGIYGEFLALASLDEAGFFVISKPSCL